MAKGEGSKGGHIIGHTKSGKPIYSAGHHIYTRHGSIASGEGTAGRMIQSYTAQDHADASDMHSAKAQEHLEQFKKKNASAPKEAQEHLEKMHAHSKASGQHVAGIRWAHEREESHAAMAERDKQRSPAEMRYRNAEAKNRADAAYRSKVQSKVARHRARMAKSIDCPECCEPMSQNYAMKSVASLAKGLGCVLTDTMASLVKGDGIQHITCPHCVATISPAFMIKSVASLARRDGLEIQPALEGMFKSRAQKSQSAPALFPVVQAPPAFGAVNRERDAMLANAIKQNGGFFGQSPAPVHVQGPRKTLLETIGETDVYNG